MRVHCKSSTMSRVSNVTYSCGQVTLEPFDFGKRNTTDLLSKHVCKRNAMVQTLLLPQYIFCKEQLWFFQSIPQSKGSRERGGVCVGVCACWCVRIFIVWVSVGVLATCWKDTPFFRAQGPIANLIVNCLVFFWHLQEWCVGVYRCKHYVYQIKRGALMYTLFS